MDRIEIDNRSLGDRIKKISILMYRYIQKLPEKDKFDELTGTHGYILSYINEKGNEAVFQKDIEKWFSIRRSTASIIISKMEQNGMLIRKMSDSDKRLRQLVLTDEAKKLCKIIDSRIKEFEKEMFDGLNEIEQDELSSKLRIVENNLKKLEEERNLQNKKLSNKSRNNEQ